MRQPRTPVDLPDGADLYLVNDDDLTFATTRPRGRSAGCADLRRRRAARRPSRRGVAVATVWDMLTTGEATAAEAVRCLTGVLRRESSRLGGRALSHPRRPTPPNCGRPTPTAATLMAQVAATCRDLAGDRNRRHAALRGFASSAGDLDDVAWLLDQAGDDVDLRWRALHTQSRARRADPRRRPAAAGARPRPGREDPGPRRTRRHAGRRREGRGVAGTGRPHRARSAPSSRSATAFWRPGQEHLLAPYRQRYLDLVPDFDRGGMIIGSAYTMALFPLFAVDDAFLAHVRAASETATPAVAKPLLERADLVRRMLRSRAAVSG